LVRFLDSVLLSASFNLLYSYQIITLFKTFSFLSLFIGSIGAVIQQKIKRFLAFTSINQIGLMLFGIFYDSDHIGSFFNMFIYSMTNIILLYVLSNLKQRGSVNSVEYLGDLRGLYSSSPQSVIYLTIALLSMAGIPPFVGFFSKYLILIPILYQDW
jgi:NADH-quinone oxidoreductase subunit N